MFAYAHMHACVCQCHISQGWGCTLVISTFEVLKQEDLRLKTSLVYIGSSRPAWTVRHCLKKKEKSLSLWNSFFVITCIYVCLCEHIHKYTNAHAGQRQL